MTDQEALALGRRLVACPRFRWMPGMLDGHNEERVVAYPPTGNPYPVRCRDIGESAPRSEWRLAETSHRQWPDLRDAATRGCLLDLLREVYQEPTLACCKDGDGERDWWTVQDEGCIWYGRGETEPEALVAALESAP